jgi:uncharacterized protein (TIGR04141 family)
MNADIAGIGDVCQSVANLHDREDYRESFSWIDQVQPVADPTLLTLLTERVVEELRAGHSDDLTIAPPEIIDWARVESFDLPHDRTQRRPTPRLQDYIAILGRRQELATIDAQVLRTQRMRALDGNGVMVLEWPIWRCLSGEIPIGGVEYVLDEGEFYTVEKSFLSALDRDIGQIADSSGLLPDSHAGTHEGVYNAETIDREPTWVLLDRRTVKIGASTTPIEICDILTSRRQLVHVKRHLGSSDLSHLFAQGLVSATLLQESPEFLTAAQEKVREACEEHQDQRTYFAEFPIRPADFEVVYAIVADWRRRSLARALPFFSKINLRHTDQVLPSRGFAVSHCKVNEV